MSRVPADHIKALVSHAVRDRLMESNNEDQTIDGTKGQSLRQMPSLDVKLMTKGQDLGFQRGPRPEQQDQH